MQQLVDAKNQELDKIGSAAKALADSTSTKHVKDISCYPWDIEGVHTFRLPAIPSWNLPTLRHASLSEKEVTKDTKLVRIAGLDNHLIGLTNKGHVLKYHGLESEETYEQGRWEYVRILLSCSWIIFAWFIFHVT